MLEMYCCIKFLSPNFLSFYFISCEFALPQYCPWHYADPISLSVAKAKAAQTAKSASLPGKPRVQQVANQKSKLAVSQPNSPSTSDSKATSKSGSTSSTPRIVGKSNLSTDLEGLHLNEEQDEAEREREREKFKERQVLSMKQEELIAKAKEEEGKSGKKNVSLIVVGTYIRYCAER